MACGSWNIAMVIFVAMSMEINMAVWISLKYK
jgi:hypothetical protein